MSIFASRTFYDRFFVSFSLFTRVHRAMSLLCFHFEGVKAFFFFPDVSFGTFFGGKEVKRGGMRVEFYVERAFALLLKSLSHKWIEGGLRKVFCQLFIAPNDPVGIEPALMILSRWARTHGILNEILSNIYPFLRRSTNKCSLFAFFFSFLSTDKAVPANRECGLYNIPEKMN